MSGSIAYLGFAGQGNVGDDAIRDAHQLFYEPAQLLRVPIRLNQRVAARLRGARVVRGRPVLMGGGTVIGRSIWRTHWNRLREQTGATPCAAIGAGVEDPTFRDGRGRSFTDSDELQHWRQLLATMEHVSVRGPRSAEILADLGLDASVVGDPTLLLHPRPGSWAQDFVAINLTLGETHWGDTSQTSNWLRRTAEAISRKSGLPTRYFALDPADVRLARKLDIRSVESFESPQLAISWLAGAAVVVSTRLHGSILSAAAGTPFIALEYRPKCLDFARSVGAEAMCHKIGESQPEEVYETVRSTLDDLSAHAARLQREVEALRGSLTTECTIVRAALLAGR